MDGSGAERARRSGASEAERRERGEPERARRSGASEAKRSERGGTERARRSEVSERSERANELASEQASGREREGEKEIVIPQLYGGITKIIKN